MDTTRARGVGDRGGYVPLGGMGESRRATLYSSHRRSTTIVSIVAETLDKQALHPFNRLGGVRMRAKFKTNAHRGDHKSILRYRLWNLGVLPQPHAKGFFQV